MVEEITLRVVEARSRDVGRGIVRIPSRYMKMLGLEPGDYIEIIGNKKTAYAQVWPAYSDDEDRDIIRMDGILRQNAGVGIGDTVRVRRVNLKPAQRVVIAPVSEPIRVDPEYLKRAYLLGKPVWKGSIIEIPYYTGSIKFVVTQVTPGPAAYVGIDTEITVREEPVKETELTIPRVTWEDIGDLEEAKQKIRELVELPLRHPEIFKHLGVEPPKGILLYGPPGCGKTLLAKAVANEANAYFIHINGPEIMCVDGDTKIIWNGDVRTVKEVFEASKLEEIGRGFNHVSFKAKGQIRGLINPVFSQSDVKLIDVLRYCAKIGGYSERDILEFAEMLKMKDLRTEFQGLK